MSSWLFWKIRSSKTKLYLFIAVLAFPDCQDSSGKTTKNNIERSFVRRSTKIIMKKFNHIGAEKFEFKHPAELIFFAPFSIQGS